MLIDTEVEDTENGHSTTTNSQRYTCQVAGLYLVSGQVCFAYNANGFRAAKLRLNGSADVIGSETSVVPVTSGSLTTTVPTVPAYVRMAVGDYVEMMGIQNSGANLGTANSGANSTQLACLWVSQ
jgi:hypothetical protein